MTEPRPTVLDAVIVEEDLHFSLTELCRACGSEPAELVVLVHEGVLQPAGEKPESWTFSGQALPRARAALRLAADLQLGPGGTALVLDLLAEIESLRTRLRRAGLE